MEKLFFCNKTLQNCLQTATSGTQLLNLLVIKQAISPKSSGNEAVAITGIFIWIHLRKYVILLFHFNPVQSLTATLCC